MWHPRKWASTGIAVGVILVALLLLPLIARIHAEGGMLREQFGAEYDAYRAARAGSCRGFIDGGKFQF